MAERLNIVIFGATGFTGQYALEELHRVSKNDKNLTWGIAGRSQSKLQKVIKDLQDKTGDDLSTVPIIIADVKDKDSLKDMCKRADLIVNCCGPYRLYGEPVVEACIASKTNHVDISGEPEYMEKMQLKYNEAAENAGIYIVSACGFDSIPADLGVVYLQKNFKGQLNSVETYLKLNYTGESIDSAVINYGTWESLVYGIANQKSLGPLRKQLYPERLPKFSPQLEKRSIIHKNKDEKMWCLPFLGSDKSVVYRTQRFFYEKSKKRPAQINTYFDCSSLLLSIAFVFVGICIGILAMFSFGRKLLLNYPKVFTFGYVSHDGPSEDVRKNTKFTLTAYGKGWDEKETDVDGKSTTKKMAIKVSGSDPAYGATNVAIIQSALTILKESDKLPGSGGVLTPGSAFADTSLIENLNKSNFTFEVIQ